MHAYLQKIITPSTGFEPMTLRLKVWYSSHWANWASMWGCCSSCSIFHVVYKHGYKFYSAVIYLVTCIIQLKRIRTYFTDVLIHIVQVLFNLANQYHANKMYTEALNTYLLIVKNKMFTNGGVYIVYCACLFAYMYVHISCPHPLLVHYSYNCIYVYMYAYMYIQHVHVYVHIYMCIHVINVDLIRTYIILC